MTVRRFRRDRDIISLEAVALDIKIVFEHLNYKIDLHTKDAHTTLYRQCVSGAGHLLGYTQKEIGAVLSRSPQAIHLIIISLSDNISHNKELKSLISTCFNRLKCQ